MDGYKISNNYQSFSNITVSFTKLPNSDDTVLGTLANDEWLTITAVADQTIDFSNNKSVPKGTLFTWTLPYSLSNITNNINSLSLNVNTKYSVATNNESLTVPFGLSLGTTSTLTSISKNWTGNISGVLASEYGSSNDAYSLPTIWTIAYNEDAAFANLFASDIVNNVANFGGSGSSGQTFVSTLISEWMAGFQLTNISYSNFNNWYVSWSPNAINGYTVLQLSAYNSVAITPTYWYNPHNSGETMTGYSIPVGSYFTWTLPYYEGGLNLTSTTISNSGISYSDYFNSSSGLPASNWQNPPLGLSIGTSSSDPTSITSSTTFKSQYSGDSSYDGVIGIGYGSKAPEVTFDFPSSTSESTK